MPRIVSVWLPRWPILRFLAAQAHALAPTLPSPACGGGLGRGQPIDPQQPFVLAVDGAGGPRIAALNEAAEDLGLLIGDRLADARAKAGTLQVRPIDPAADDAALRRLRCGPRATRRPSRRGARRTAPTASSSTSPARRICSAARRACSPILRSGSIASACRRGSPSPIPRAPPGRSRAFILRRSLCFLPGSEAEALAPLPIEALRLLARHPHHAAPARLQAHRRPDRQAARAVRRALRTRAAQASRPGARPRRRAARLHRAAAGLSQPALSHRTHRHAAGGDRHRDPPDEGHRPRRSSATAPARAGCGLRSIASTARCATLDIGLTLPTRNVAHVARLIDLKLERHPRGRIGSMPASASRRSGLPSRPPSAWRSSRLELPQRCSAMPPMTKSATRR